jgi:hypothetical protein
MSQPIRTAFFHESYQPALTVKSSTGCYVRRVRQSDAMDSGTDEYCYWYPAADVIVTDTWVEYTLL